MKVTDIWNSNNKPTISFELFPPRSFKAAENLEIVIDKLSKLKPDLFSVTFGAGGSTKDGSLQLLEKLMDKKNGACIVAYFSCYGLGIDHIIEVLDKYQELGIENILVVRGDPPEEDEYSPHPDSFTYAYELVNFIRPRYDYCIGVAGYPEGHVKAPSKEKDIEFLKLKVDQGAEYIISNYFYDNQFFFDFADRCLSANINVPILPGVMPIFSVKMMNMLAELCGATITDEIQQSIAKIPEDDKERLMEFGTEFALNQCRGLLKSGVPGLHFYTMDRSKSAVAIVTQLRKEKLI